MLLARFVVERRPTLQEAHERGAVDNSLVRQREDIFGEREELPSVAVRKTEKLLARLSGHGKRPSHRLFRADQEGVEHSLVEAPQHENLRA